VIGKRKGVVARPTESLAIGEQLMEEVCEREQRSQHCTHGQWTEIISISALCLRPLMFDLSAHHLFVLSRTEHPSYLRVQLNSPVDRAARHHRQVDTVWVWVRKSLRCARV
jgi:hypothetical protein